MKIEELIDGGEQTAQNVRALLNIHLKSPYFYKTDDRRQFLVLTRYKRAFEAFFNKFFGWLLVMDAKCARLLKLEMCLCARQHRTKRNTPHVTGKSFL